MRRARAVSSRTVAGPRMRGSWRTAAAAVVLGLAGCGTTVPLAQQGTAGRDGLGPPAAQVPGSPTGNGARGDAAPPGATPAARIEDGLPPVGPSPVPTGVDEWRNPPGVTATEILVGTYHATQPADSFNQSIGAGAVTFGDVSGFERAAVEELNSHGGILGRKVRIVHHDYDPNSTQTTAQLEESACQTWTQDHRVFAVLAGGTDVLHDCLARRGVVQICSDCTSSAADATTFARFRTYLEVGAMDVTRQAQIYPDGLAAQGFFAPGTRVGVVTFDTVLYHRAYRVLAASLARHGVSVTDSAFVGYPASNPETARTAANIQNTVLRFSSDKVDRVMFLDYGGNIALFFLRDAENQLYRPRYGFLSTSGGQAITTVVPKQQLHGAISVGWVPLVDVGSGPGSQQGPWLARCMALMRRHGVQMASDLERAYAGAACDGFRFLKQTMERGGTRIDASSLVRGAESLGRAFDSSLTYTTRYDGQHHSGAAAVRFTAFDDDCGCYKYAGALRSVA